MITNFTHYVPVRFPAGDKSYFFGTNDSELEEGNYVIVDTISGFEMGIVTGKPMNMSAYHSSLELKAVVRRANSDDLEDYEMGLRQAKISMQIADREAKKLNLGMNFISAAYSLDGSKITMTYTAENRVDFRELLKILAGQLRCRIELRQIAPRDKAKAVGGMGICGLSLCCSTFLNSFDGISISRAKNQMLTLNIPKLSGQCGRLKCCLLFEDDMYTEAKKNFPQIGDKVHLPTGEYAVSSFNIMSQSIKLQSEDDVQFMTLEEFKNLNKPQQKKVQFPNRNDTRPTKNNCQPKENSKQQVNADANKQDRPHQHYNNKNNKHRYNNNQHRGNNKNNA